MCLTEFVRALLECKLIGKTQDEILAVRLCEKRNKAPRGSLACLGNDLFKSMTCRSVTAANDAG